MLLWRNIRREREEAYASLNRLGMEKQQISRIVKGKQK